MTVLPLYATRGRPFRPRRLPVWAHRPAEATGPPEDGDESGKLRVIERELTAIQGRLDRLLATIRSDDIAPLPSVYEDGEGEG